MSALPPKDGVIGRRSCGQLKDFWVLRIRLMVKRGHRCTGPKHQEKRRMDYFAGLDVSVKDTSVCIVDDTGIVREVGWRASPRLCWLS